MELPVVSAAGPVPSLGASCDSADARCLGAKVDRPDLFNVPIPADLRHLGESVLASGFGDSSNPPLVLLGGISGNCFPCTQPDGSGGWWFGLAGEGSPIGPERHYVIGVDFAGDESGQSAPSTFDQARVLAAALESIGIDRPVTIIGASYGGMVALALAEIDPARVGRLVIISAGAEPHPAATAARELQRRVVALGVESGRGDEALAIARGMAMLSYRTPEEFAVRFEGGIAESAPQSCSQPGGYLRARGQAFLSVMSPGRFLSLSASIDRHCVHPQRIAAPALLIGADSDQLVFPAQMQALASALSGPVELHVIDSLFGHDMFLKEAERVGRIVAPFLAPRE